jgi:hypothetical protein
VSKVRICLGCGVDLGPDCLTEYERCPIDGKPATMLAGNCGHSWSAALRGATERPLDVERLGRAAAALKDIGEYPTDRAYGTALAAEYARLTPTTTTPETEG